MSRFWLRVDAALPRHPKVIALAGAYGLPMPEGPALVVGFLVSWWGYCTEFGRNGISARCPQDVLTAFAAPLVKLSRLSVVPEIAVALKNAGLMDRDGLPNDWQDWSGQLLKRRKSDADRKRKSRGHGADRRDPVVEVEESSKDSSSPRLRVEPQNEASWMCTMAATYPGLDVLLMHLPEAYHADLAGCIRAGVPLSVVAIVRDHGEGGMTWVESGRPSWEQVGRAVRECAQTGGIPSPAKFRGFLRPIVQGARDTSRPATRQDRAFEVIENTPLPESA